MANFTVRTSVRNRGGIAKGQSSGGWYVIYDTPGGVREMYVRYDSRTSVRDLLAEIGVDMCDAIVERVR